MRYVNWTTVQLVNERQRLLNQIRSGAYFSEANHEFAVEAEKILSLLQARGDETLTAEEAQQIEHYRKVVAKADALFALTDRNYYRARAAARSMAFYDQSMRDDTAKLWFDVNERLDTMQQDERMVDAKYDAQIERRCKAMEGSGSGT